jgi:lysophospholipase L1-like esterase
MDQTSLKEHSNISLPRKILYGAIVTLSFFLFVEAVLRLAGFSFNPEIFHEERVLRWANKGVEQDPSMSWSWIPKPEAVCHIDGQPAFRFNRLGYRGPEFPIQKPSGMKRIVCMGDSSTLGWGVKDDETFCYRLARLLQTNIRARIETINAGVFGYTSHQGLHQLKTRIVQLHPDIIIFSYNWNDHSAGIPLHEQEGSQRDKDLGSATNGFQNWQRKLFELKVFQFMDSGYYHIRRPAERQIDDADEEDGSIPRVLRVSADDYRQNLNELIQVARAHGVVPILMTQPFRHRVNDDPETRYLLSKQFEYNGIMIQAGEAQHVEVVDLVPVFKKNGPQTRLYSSRVHPTAFGHELIAQELASRIAARYLEPQSR